VYRFAKDAVKSLYNLEYLYSRMSRKIVLDENSLPKNWYNILPDLPKPLPPPIDPSTKAPVDPKKLERILPKSLSDRSLVPIDGFPFPKRLGMFSGFGGPPRSTGL
jgi:hypothetical protein